MKHLLAAPLLLAMAATGAAFAADLDLPRAVPVKAPVVPAIDWTGFHLGAHGGWGWSKTDAAFVGTDPAGVAGLILGGAFGGDPAGSPGLAADGATAGVGIGYDWQIDRRWLVGLSADISWSDITGSGDTTFLVTRSFTRWMSIATRRDVDWYGTVMARLGVLPTERLLVYGTGGFAYGRVSSAVELTSAMDLRFNNPNGGFDCTFGGACFAGSSARIGLGWAAGAGVEYALTTHLTVRGEYLHVDLGGDSVDVAATTPPAGNRPASFTAAIGHGGLDILRAGVRYRF
ncbi:outer membrane beta-barrel protein [Rhodoplanes sp. TEM]|uniref:Outer membrane beta-barrel protein n=1 Tax=Rhodoplanes tepidamans TaxID=200616 RepID=A0ABT5J4B1_RHOTP|nr:MULTISPECIES: outer membrane beta-barrel protein [Rhodoplanes]MDC7784485.1 outer membrane beta-barrel protein [Rhodoplanes tepidamans]MDC7983515.1 outer membrane beta-barrel protein [Rhodoplanes sp. TEM]MDQ0356993.1 outer membrane immunogenic protein [Rhodoplanes tepidamans]